MEIQEATDLQLVTELVARIVDGRIDDSDAYYFADEISSARKGDDESLRRLRAWLREDNEALD